MLPSRCVSSFAFKTFNIWLTFSLSSLAWGADYKKATEGREVVMDKLYPKGERFELGLPQIGFVMNQSYVTTFLIGGSATYYTSENLGFSFDFSVAQNSDKPERTCIENFFYDPSNEVGSACGEADLLQGADKNNDEFPRYGPAYVPVRELQNIMIANIVWAPIYGKQLLFLSATSYFDVFFELGLGLANSVYYPKRDILENGKVPRGTYTNPANQQDPSQATANNNKIGALPSEVNSYGELGRPDVVNGTNVLLNLGLGQKFHFGKLFHLKFYVRNMTLLGTDQGFENLISLYGGAGLRF